jgi:hypothetical protein
MLPTLFMRAAAVMCPTSPFVSSPVERWWCASLYLDRARYERVMNTNRFSVKGKA